MLLSTRLTFLQVPSDGPAGKLLDLLDRHHYRPGHIHIIVRNVPCACIIALLCLIADFQIIREGYNSITTQIFDSETPYLDNDSVFAVKDGLTVKFESRKGDPKAEWELEYNITMAPVGSAVASNVPITSEGAFS